MALAGIVLCGGNSRRMGTPKAWLEVGGETLLARTVRVLATVAAPVVVVAASAQDVPPLPPGVDVVRDAADGRGPLQGVASGLDAIAAHADAAFVAATDAPFLHPALVRRLEELRQAADDAVVPRVGGVAHGLAAVYSTSARAVIAATLAAGVRRLGAALERMRTRYVDESGLLAGAELKERDPTLASLVNVNTPEEYAAALAAFPVPSRP